MKKKTVSIFLTLGIVLATMFAGTDVLAAEKGTELKDLPTSWDLTELYADEEAFEADMKMVEELIPAIKAHKGKLNSVEGILEDLEDPDILKIRAILNKADMYTVFLSSLDASDPWAKKAAARLNEVNKKVSLASAYEDPEIMKMSLKKRQEIFSDKKLAPYTYAMKDFTDPDKVVLSEEAKRVETLMGQAAKNTDIHDIFDYIDLPKPTFTYPDGTEGTYSDAVYAEIVQNKEYDHEFRKEMYELRNSMREPYANTYASLLEGEMRKNWASAQIYGFDSTLDHALHKSDVDHKVYDKIIDFSHNLLPKVYEYYEARKELLGLDEIMVCDLNLSVTQYQPKKMSYEDAVNMGRKGIAVWGDDYLDTFDKIITSPHIDVYPAKTKTTGAFESLEGNETKPFVLLNFDGTETYTTTIVHEMGHAVYSEYAAKNQNEYNNVPDIFTQEVASTANEIMLRRYMIENAKSEDEKLFWLDNEIDLFLGTIVRQCLYSEFEDYCYKTIENGGTLDPGAMAEKWLELQHLYYGEGMTIPEDSGIDWARIPHLYYDYYVYQYATSLTYAASICNRVDEEGQEAIDDYLEFLKAGKSADPATLLSIAGVDPLDDATYESAEALIEDLIDEFIETSGAGKKGQDKKEEDKKEQDKKENNDIGFRFVDAKEGSKLLLSNSQYYDKLSKEDLRYRMQDKDADLKSYRELAGKQTRDFTPKEEKAIEDAISFIEKRFDEIGFKWPVDEDILFVKTTMKEEPGAGGYTHKNQVYLADLELKYGYSDDKDERDWFNTLIAHELSHALTRNVPKFREELYKVIGFEVDDKEPDFSDKVRESILSNPDVEAYDCHGQFTIDGKKTDATIVTKIKKPYKKGAVMLENVEAALVPIDDPDHFVSVEDVPDFNEVVGENTGYVIAAEECMADNFASAIVYGLDKDYKNPEIIEGILDFMSKDAKKLPNHSNASSFVNPWRRLRFAYSTAVW